MLQCGVCVSACSRVGRTLHRYYSYFSSSLSSNTRIWLDGVQCTGSESNIADCKHMAWGSTDCNHGDDVSIACHDNTTSTPPSELSLNLYAVDVLKFVVCVLWSWMASLINQSIKSSICKVLLKQSSQTCLFWVGLHKEVKSSQVAFNKNKWQ